MAWILKGTVGSCSGMCPPERAACGYFGAVTTARCSGWLPGMLWGTTLELKSPGTFKPLSDMVGGGPFNLQPGQWTDDTSMALCLGESLVHCHGFDPKDQMSATYAGGKKAT
jgi:ADP-ribosylglycohydrolase